MDEIGENLMKLGTLFMTALAAIVTATGSASAGVTDINITGAFGNKNWDTSAGWHEGQQWGWYPDATNPTHATGWTMENWIAGGPAKLTLDIQADTDPDVTITKNLVNTTSFAWTSFEI